VKWTTALITILLFSSICFSSSASMLVPAVVSDGEGQMIRLQVEIRNGTGLIYTTTSPLVGIDTQTSERTAVSVGIARAGGDIRDYDAFLTMDAGEAKQVDGPSAGAAMALLASSALTGKRIRRDFTITGTIDERGNIGPVGGVSSKVEAASKNNITIIAVPSTNDVFEKIMLGALRGKFNITIIEVSQIEEAERIAFSQEGTLPEITPPRPPSKISGLKPYNYSCNGCNLDVFAAVAEKVYEDANKTVEDISSGKQNGYDDVIQILNNGVADSGEMLKNGYYYTAANNAFLTLVDARVLQGTNITRRELGLFLSETGRCIDSLKRPTMTKENMELVAGGDLRAVWARQKLVKVREMELNISNQEAMLYVYREALYAMGWCDVAKELYSAAERVGGEGIDEGLLRGFAESKVREAKEAYASAPGIGSDTETHLNGAEYALNSSFYVAAVLDSNYVLGFAEAERFSGMSEAEVFGRAERLSSTQGKRMWPALFYAHSRFYWDTQGPAGVGSVLRLGSMAEKMDEDLERVDYLLRHPENAPQPSQVPQTSASEEGNRVNEALVILVILLSVLLVVSAVLNIVVFTSMKNALKTKGITESAKRIMRMRKRRG